MPINVLCRFWQLAVHSFSPFMCWIWNRNLQRDCIVKTRLSCFTAMQQHLLRNVAVLIWWHLSAIKAQFQFILSRASNGSAEFNPTGRLKLLSLLETISTHPVLSRFILRLANALSPGAGGRVHVWDMRSFRCLTEFIDQGTLHCTSLKVCPKQQYLATGSDAGVVNIYKAGDCMLPSVSSSTPSPVKTIFNLRTEIDTIEFHPASQVGLSDNKTYFIPCFVQMVAIGSMHMTSAIRLVHLPSCTIFANWPNQRLSKTRVKCVSFSPGGDLMHVGSLSGRISSYRLMHYFK